MQKKWNCPSQLDIKNRAKVIRAIKAVCGPNGASINDIERCLNQKCSTQNIPLSECLDWLQEQNVVSKFRNKIWFLRPNQKPSIYNDKGLVPSLSKGRCQANKTKCRHISTKRKTSQCRQQATRNKSLLCRYKPPQRKKLKSCEQPKRKRSICRYKPPQRINCVCNKPHKRSRSFCRYKPPECKKPKCCYKAPKRRPSKCHYKPPQCNNKPKCCYKGTKRKPFVCRYKPPKCKKSKCRKPSICRYKSTRSKKQKCRNKSTRSKKPKCRKNRSKKKPKYRDMIINALQDKERLCYERIAQYLDKYYDTRNDFVVKQTLKWLISKEVVTCSRGCYSLTGRPLNLYVGKCNDGCSRKTSYRDNSFSSCCDD